MSSPSIVERVKEGPELSSNWDVEEPNTKTMQDNNEKVIKDCPFSLGGTRIFAR